MDFEWDAAKERINVRKHGVSFARAAETFRDPYGIKLKDTQHSKGEERFLWVGKDADGNLLTTRFTMRGAKVRIIGCANWRKFRRYYYEANKKTEV